MTHMIIIEVGLLFNAQSIAECLYAIRHCRNLASNLQEEAIRMVENSHNLLLTDQAGSGKTRVLKEIIPMLQGKHVAVLCTTGLAAMQMSEFKTIHRYCRRVVLLRLICQRPILALSKAISQVPYMWLIRFMS